jgi:hypothetical protein
MDEALVFCPRCGTRASGTPYCGQCGQPLHSVPDTAAVQAVAPVAAPVTTRRRGIPVGPLVVIAGAIAAAGSIALPWWVMDLSGKTEFELQFFVGMDKPMPGFESVDNYPVGFALLAVGLVASVLASLVVLNGVRGLGTRLAQVLSAGIAAVGAAIILVGFLNWHWASEVSLGPGHIVLAASVGIVVVGALLPLRVAFRAR